MGKRKSSKKKGDSKAGDAEYIYDSIIVLFAVGPAKTISCKAKAKKLKGRKARSSPLSLL